MKRNIVLVVLQSCLLLLSCSLSDFTYTYPRQGGHKKSIHASAKNGLRGRGKESSRGCRSGNCKSRKSSIARGQDQIPVKVVRGLDGKPGKDGGPGRNGKDGTPGEPGRDGQDGEPGRDGQDGKDGEPGRDGKDGEPGRDGQNGEPGICAYLDLDFIHSFSTEAQPYNKDGTQFQDILFHKNSEAIGWTHTAGSSNFVCPHTAQYLVTYTVGAGKFKPGSANVVIRAKFGPSEQETVVPGSDSGIFIPSILITSLSQTFLLDGVEGENLKLEFRSDVPGIAGLTSVGGAETTASIVIRELL